MINTIIFDFDNTLYSYDPCHLSGLNASLNELSKYSLLDSNTLQDEYKKSQKEVKLHTNNQAASHNRLLYFKNLCERLNIESFSLPLKLEEIYWSNYIEQIRLFPGVIELLNELKKRNLKIGMCTDLTTQIQLRKILNCKLNTYFDVIITSEEAGVEKPNQYIFKLTLDKLGSRANECLFIGDSFEKDIRGSINFGMQAIYLSDKTIEGYTCAKTFLDVKRMVLEAIGNE